MDSLFKDDIKFSKKPSFLNINICQKQPKSLKEKKFSRLFLLIHAICNKELSLTGDKIDNKFDIRLFLLFLSKIFSKWALSLKTDLIFLVKDLPFGWTGWSI